jgi:hypothetical protein
VRLSDDLLKEFRKFSHEYNLESLQVPVDFEGKFDPAHKEKLKRILDHALGILNWASFLILTDEITDPELVTYFKGAILQYFDKFYTPHKKDLGDFVYLSRLYTRFKEDSKQK